MATGMAIDLCNKKKTNNAQTIKGTKREVFMFGSLIPYQCGEIATDVFWGERRWYYPENEMPGETVQETACDIGETGSGWIIVSLKCPN